MKKNFSIPTISQYLQYLSFDSQEIFTYALFDKDSIGVIPGWGTVFGKSSDILTAVRAVPDSTLHVCLNRTGLHGRRRKDIEQCRVFCVDIDSVGKIPKCNASLIVESSPGKYHLYWKCAFSIGLEKWSAVQLALAAQYGGDFSLAEVTKTIRVPGVPRRTKEGKEFLPRIVRAAAQCPVFSDDNLNELFTDGDFNEWWERGRKAKEKLQRDINRHCRDFRDNPGTTRKMLSGGGRNNALYEYIRDESRSGKVTTESQAISAARAFNKSFGEPLEDFEVEKTALSGLVRGSEAREKIQGRLARYKDMLPDASENEVNGSGEIAERVKVLKKQKVKKPTLPSFNYNYDAAPLKINAFTDAGVVERVVQRYGESICVLDKRVLAFNSGEKVWREQDKGACREIGEFVDGCLLDTLVEYKEAVENEKGAEGLIAKAEQRFQGSKLRRDVVHNVYASHQIKRVQSGSFDANPDLILVGNGVLDMVAATVRPAIAKDYMLARTSVKWDENAKCPFWDKYITEVLNSESLVDFMQELFGYSLSGNINAQSIFCHFGGARNGKSKVLFALRTIAGEYGTYVDPDEIVRSKGGYVKNFERFGYKIEGKRVGIIDDIDTATIWNEAFVKGCTADSIRARGEHEKSREVANRCKVHLGLNVPPKPEAENLGLLRRLCFIPYPNTFPQDMALEEKIKREVQREASGILRWAIEGYQRVVANEGLSMPKEVEIATQEYREDNFPIENVVGEMFSLKGEMKWYPLSQLIQEVNVILTRKGMDNVSNEALGRALAQKRFVTKKSRFKGTVVRGYNVCKKYDEKELTANLLQNEG